MSQYQDVRISPQSLILGFVVIIATFIALIVAGVMGVFCAKAHVNGTPLKPIAKPVEVAQVLADVGARAEVKPLGALPIEAPAKAKSTWGEECGDPTLPLDVTTKEVLNAFGPIGAFERLEFVLHEGATQYYCSEYNVGLHFETDERGRIMRITLVTTQAVESANVGVDQLARVFVAYQQLASVCEPRLDKTLGTWVLGVYRLIGTESELRASGHRLVVMATAREMSPGQCGLMCRISRLQ